MSAGSPKRASARRGTARARTSVRPSEDSSDGVRVLVQRLDADLPLPAYARSHDAGLDLRASRAVTLPPGARALVPTGIAIAIPAGFAGLVLPRSGLARDHGVSVLNTPGLVDAGYRGEVQVLLVNHDVVRSVTLERGARIAQLVIVRVGRAALTAVDALPPSERGSGGFGSTGR
jgi:dUTP diphosphatase